MRNDGTYLAQLLQEQQRPHPMYMRQQYHFMGGPGWINDPNGLVWYKDAYHFFYQYNPFGLTWGEPCWGHAVSRDLLHWTQLPPALVPSEPYDMYEQGGCFSGSALVVGQRLYLLYTGVCEKDGHCVQAQCLAWSDDGVTFQKYENNPVVCAPVGVDPANFRDPKLWREADGTFYFVCGASLEGDGAALLFSSQDLFQWQYQGVLARSEGRFGTMWECPDLIPLGRKHMLCVSPMSAKCCRTEAVILTSRTLTPSSSQSLTALDFVRFVVPKHGMVTHRISFRLRPARSNARTHTSSASVLSNPPEIPSTTVFACVCSSRFLSPCDWMRRIASARARSCSSYGGTNGLGAMCRVSTVSRSGWSKGTT